MELRVDTPGERLDAFLAARLPDLSRSRIQVLIREQYIIVNDHPAKPRDAVKTGDRISIAIPEAVPLDAAEQSRIVGETEKALAASLKPRFVVDPTIIGGLVVLSLIHISEPTRPY